MVCGGHVWCVVHRAPQPGAPKELGTLIDLGDEWVCKMRSQAEPLVEVEQS